MCVAEESRVFKVGSASFASNEDGACVRTFKLSFVMKAQTRSQPLNCEARRTGTGNDLNFGW
jgi:hypothetical protein